VGAIAFILIVLVAVLVFTATKSILLQRRVTELENRLSTLERSVRGSVAQPSPVTDVPDISLVDPHPETRSPIPITQTPVTSPRSPIPVPTPPAPSRTREEWEAFVGGRLLNRIGAFAIIIGIGFFLKHAFDNNWISEPVRVLSGILIGVAALVIARRTHTRGFSIFAQGLVGAGIAILYLSVYASFNYYSLVPQLPAFLLMAAVTAVALAHGIWYGSLAVAVLGWAGGFLTPWMLSTGEPNEVKLFVYLALLTVAMLGLVVRMPQWSVLQAMTLAGTCLWYFLWHMEEYSSDVMTITLFFVLVFWAAFVAADQVQQRLQFDFRWERRATLFANAAFGLLAVITVVPSYRDALTGLVLLAMAGAYLLPFVHAEVRPDGPYGVSITTISSSLSLVGIGYLLSDHGDVAGWAALVVVLVGAARQYGLRHLVVVGQLFLLLAAAHLATIHEALVADFLRDFVPFLHERSIGFAGLAAGSFAAFYLLRNEKEHAAARNMFLTVAAVTVIVYGTVEVNDLLRSWRLDLDRDPMAFRWFLSVLLVGSLWVAFGLASFVLGIRQRLEALLWVGVVTLILGLLVVALRGVSVNVIAYHSPLLNLRVVIMLGVASAAVAAAWIALRSRDVAPLLLWVHPLMAVAAAVVFFSLLSGETLDWFERSVAAAQESGREVLADLRDEQQLALSLVWLLYSVILMVVGFWRSNRGLRLIAMGLFGVTILKIFLVDLSSLETAYRIVSFIGLGAILLGVSYGYQRYKHLLME
jgi:uncharacterized membrane protein